MIRLFLVCTCMLLMTGCLATGPVSFAWRSNSSLQYATTDGKTTNDASNSAVNADKTTEANAAVSTASQATANRTQAEATK